MDNYKFTKGKWAVKASNEYTGDYSIKTENGAPTSFEDEANALLISKAPEMLEMLEELIYAFEGKNLHTYQEERLEEAKQLIKEATEL